MSVGGLKFRCRKNPTMSYYGALFGYIFPKMKMKPRSSVWGNLCDLLGLTKHEGSSDQVGLLSVG